jgi:capsular exopolysaccharide synthesis family protein
MTADDPRETAAPAAASRRSFAAIIMRYWPVVVIATVLGALAAFLAARAQDPVYSASAQVLVNNAQLSTQLSGQGVQSDPNRVLATQATLVTLPVVAGRVQERLGLPEDQASVVAAATSVDSDTNSDILTITSESGSPELAVSLANAFAGEFVRYRSQIDSSTYTRALRDLRRRIQALEEAGTTTTPFYQQLTRLEETLRTQITLGARNSTVVQPATSAAQVAPRPVRSGVLGGLLGLVAGIVAAWILHLVLDRRVRNEDDVNEVLGAALLARVPRLPRGWGEADGPAVLTQPNSSFAESMRILATTVDLANVGGRSRVLLMTSAAPGDGKSTTAVNLAVALARIGPHTALADFDLRRPAVARQLGLSRGRGIVDVLASRARLDDVVRPVDLSADGHGAGGLRSGTAGRLDAIPSGRIPPNPGEYTVAGAVSGLFDQLRERYEVSVVDAPPWLPFGDALALARRADGVVAVVRARRSLRKDLAELRRRLESSSARLLGYVLIDAHQQGTATSYYREYAEALASGGPAEPEPDPVPPARSGT